MMRKRRQTRTTEGWVEFVIISFVVLTVLGAILLALQDQAVDIGSTRHPLSTPKLATPTPTQAALFDLGRDTATPIPVPEMPSD